jgi:hypothetical protein
MERRRVTAVPAAILALLSLPGAQASNISYSQIRWNDIPVRVVTVNLNSSDLKVTAALARDGAGSSEPFHSMLNRLQPSAAITGTFFCTQSLLPTGDIVIEGKRVHRGSVGTGVCFTSRNEVEFVPLKKGRSSGWEGFESVLCAGPTLVRDGEMFLSPKAEGYTDRGVYVRKTRTALGVTKGNKLLMVSVPRPIYLRSLAKIMLHLGAVHAVDLDGGASSALYYRGSVLARPGRRLTNLLVVYDSLNAYLKHRSALAPGIASTVTASASVSSEAVPRIPDLMIGRPYRYIPDFKYTPPFINLRGLATDAEAPPVIRAR